MKYRNAYEITMEKRRQERSKKSHTLPPNLGLMAVLAKKVKSGPETSSKSQKKKKESGHGE